MTNLENTHKHTHKYLHGHSLDSFSSIHTTATFACSNQILVIFKDIGDWIAAIHYSKDAPIIIFGTNCHIRYSKTSVLLSSELFLAWLIVNCSGLCIIF